MGLSKQVLDSRFAGKRVKITASNKTSGYINLITSKISLKHAMHLLNDLYCHHSILFLPTYCSNRDLLIVVYPTST